ncbi:hypothetical protein F4604DRAFT_1963829 [Suillus subluteus]|nr:hypothetical protein F4604DRAFT_1963829 [Suillus subluteus]
MFLVKQPSIKTRILNPKLCPPHDLVHAIESYPTYYDPLYYPHYYPQIFSTPEKFCAWLQACLSSHGDMCGSCRSIYKSTAVLYDGSALCVWVDDTFLTFPRSHFESPLYSHCSVFRRLSSLHDAAAPSTGAVRVTAASCIASRVDDDPSWFAYPDDGLRTHLLALSAAILSSAVRLLCGRRCLVPRYKNGCVDFIMRDLSARKTQLSSLTHEDLLDQLSSTAVPIGCPRTRSTVLAAEFEKLYGEQVAIALRAPPEVVAVIGVPHASSAASVELSMTWLSVSIDELTRRLEKVSRADIQLCLRRLPSTFRKPSDMRSHRKTCNALAHHIRERAFSLSHACPTLLADVFLAHFPFAHSYDQSDAVLVAQILAHEFGLSIMTRLSQELLSASAKLKVVRDEHRRCAIEEAETIRGVREAEWPVCAPQNVVLNCLNDYVARSAWTEPSVCAVCSCYDRDLVAVCLSDDLAPYHLDLLRVPEDIMSRESARFSVSVMPLSTA